MSIDVNYNQSFVFFTRISNYNIWGENASIYVFTTKVFSLRKSPRVNFVEHVLFSKYHMFFLTLFFL